MSRLHGVYPVTGTGFRPSCVFVLCLVVFAVTPACMASVGPANSGVNAAQPPLDSVDLCLQDERKTISLRAERAGTDEQRSIGLMGRAQLADDAGMLFVYGREKGPGSGFWMYRTLLPLDIAYLGPEGEIRAIRSMEPCRHEDPAACPTYLPGISYWSALEVNQGFFEQHELGVGAKVIEVGLERCQPEPDNTQETIETGR